MRVVGNVKLTFLGTSAGTPSKSRGLPSIIIQDDVNHVLLDVGEGTQYRLMNLSISVHKITHILISHLHGDHVFGLPGLLASMTFLNRRKDLVIIGPEPIREFIMNILRFISEPTFRIKIIEIKPSNDVVEILRSENMTIKYTSVKHTIPSHAYALTWKLPYGKFLPEKARELEIPLRYWSKLQFGESIKLRDGKVVKPEEVTIPYRKREFTIVYTGDTAPCENLVKIASNADVLIHESTFKANENKDVVWNQGHSRNIDAAETARKASVNLLILTHVSTRYATDHEVLEQILNVFPNTLIAKDLLKINFKLKTMIK